MAHDPRIFVGPSQAPDRSGTQLHAFHQNSPYCQVMINNAAAYGLREFTAQEYLAWDGGDRTYTKIEAHGK